MSSTNRNAVRNDKDYYFTPIKTIQDFWVRFCENEKVTIDQFSTILDPCAGGDKDLPCAYPYALKKFQTEGDDQEKAFKFWTIDIRQDSQAFYKLDFLTNDVGNAYSLIISNPPFSHFVLFVLKSLTMLEKDGYLIFLQRVNVAGSIDRIPFWKQNKPKAIYIHSKRPSFMKGSSDSCEYAHFVWQKGYEGKTEFLWV